MFLHLSVILSTRVSGRHPLCRYPPWADTPPGRHPLGRHPHPLGRHSHPLGKHPPPRQTPPGRQPPHHMVTTADGTHLTSCFCLVSGPDWYLSHNGSDTSTCGRNVSNACKTLDWLLDRFYHAPYTLNETLSLVTDTSLIINNNLVVS